MNLEMSIRAVEHVQAYYDERVADKLRDFTSFNPRIEAAIETLAEWAPPAPRRVLEIGCGIGATSWRMARAWSGAEVIGADISAGSIDVARACFRRPNLRYRAGIVDERAFSGRFDLVLLMDVYEHIAIRDREALHRTLRALLADESRVVVTVPTPALQRFLEPRDLQPVDEDIGLPEVIALAEATATGVLCYRQVGIWRYGDYAHIVLGRHRHLEDVALRQRKPSLGMRHAIRTFMRGFTPPGRRDYFGTDLLRPAARDPASAFHVSAAERERIAAAWKPGARPADGAAQEPTAA